VSLSPEDRRLGLDRPITRRDFLNGVALAVGGGAGGFAQAADDPGAPGSPGGFAGQTLAAAAWMHARRDGAPRAEPPPFDAAEGETADLVVVGAGISGLAAAWLYRRHGPRDARVLVLDALPEPGGHAQRNEFVARDGRRVIGYGGSEALDSPSLWSPATQRVIRELGIDLKRFQTWYDAGWLERHGLVQHATWFDAASWGEAKLVRHPPDMRPAEWVAQLPLKAAARADLLALLEGRRDPFPRWPRARKRARLAELTYERFVVETLGLDPQVAQFYNARTRSLIGVGADATSALDAWALGLPGFDAMKLGDAPDARMSPSGRQAKAGRDEYIYHFPDGNAGVVRCLLRALVPDCFPDARTDIESLVVARRDDAALDVPGAPVRIRLNASVVDVRHAGGDPRRARAVDVAWADAQGTLRTVRARQVVLACFHRAIPFMCPELPAAQVEALNDQVKVPLIYGNVLLGNWRAFKRAGIPAIRTPGLVWDEMRLDFPVSIGDYRFADDPSEPVLLHLGAVVLDGPRGAPERAQCAAGRRRLAALRFEDLEREIRATLDGALGEFGFDAARDIEAITLNRWAHGYAYEYMRPWDDFWPDGPLPCVAARRGWGRIAIANADAGAYAYVQGAIDQAARAVAELLPSAKLPPWWTTPGPRLHDLAR